MLRNDTYCAIGCVGGGTWVVRLLYRGIFTVFREGDLGTLHRLVWVIVVGAWVHVGVGNTQVLSDIGSNPVSWILMCHRDDVSLVLSRAWHIEVLRSRVKLHAKGELCLLLSNGVGVVRVPGIGEVKVAWDVVLWTWNSHELHLFLLFLLDLTDLFSKISVFLTEATSGALTASRGGAEWRRFGSVRHIDWVMSAWAEVLLPFILDSLFSWSRLSKAPGRCLRWISRTVSSWSWDSVRLVALPLWTTSERLRCASLGELRVVGSSTRRILCQICLLLNVSHSVGEGVTICLVRFHELPLIVIDVAVVCGAWGVELLLSLVGRCVLLSARAPGGHLRASHGAMSGLN